MAHTKGIVASVKLLSKRFDLDIDKMISLAWVHDIGYYLKNGKPHAENSLNILKKEGFEINESMEDCILNHGNSGKPKTKEGKIIQIADKISILNDDFLEVLLSKKNIKKEEIGFVKIMCDKSLDMLEKYSGLK